MAYRVPVLENFNWQPSVKDRLDTAPGSPTKGDRYLVIGTPASPWDGKANYIAYCSATGTPGTWAFDAPKEGMIVWVDDEDKYYHYTGSAWEEYLGQQGIQGTKGDQGTKGTKGDQGTKGTKGDQGTKGTKGDQGTHGTRGTQGTKGSKGDQGTHGTRGTQGTKGSKGDQGTKGATGATGPTGPGATYSASYGCLIIETS